MALEIRDGDGNEKHIRSFGDGTIESPFEPFNITRDYLEAVGAGDIPGAEEFGGFGEVARGEDCDVWDGPTVRIPEPPAGGIQMQVKSSDSEDGVGGDGVRSVNLEVIRADGSAAIESITMNGATPVLTALTDILFINHICSSSVGDTGVAEGDITVEAVGGATVYAQITATGNQELSTGRMVPSGKVLYINSFTAGEMSDKKVSVRLRTQSHGGVLVEGVYIYKATLVLKKMGDTIPISPPIKVPAGAKVKASCWTTDNTIVSANWHGWIENA